MKVRLTFRSYRVNIFGFPNAAGLNPREQNLGTLDQRLGLEWVHRHIQAFGGDPNRLTHWGQSAGARSVDCHAFSYPSKPLVRNLIMNSGSSILKLPVSDPNHEQFSYVAQGLGFPGGHAMEELAFMREQSADAIIEFLRAHSMQETVEPLLSFQPVVNDYDEFDDYEKRAQAGNFSKLVSTSR